MLMKEKIIFWPLFGILICIFIIGFYLQGNRKAATDEFLKDIETATEKARLKKKKATKDTLDFSKLKTSEVIEGDASLIQRGLFLKPFSEERAKKTEEVISLPKQEEVKKPIFVYKGRMMVGTKVMVIIEDQGTGKSFSVREGDMAGDFLVLGIDEKEVRLKNKEGEELILSTAKKEKENKEEPREAVEKTKGSK